MLTTKELIDWDKVISNLINSQGSMRHIDQTIDQNKTDIKSYHELIKKGFAPEQFSRTPFFNMVKNWNDSGYNFKNINFKNYYPTLEQYAPDSHFSKSIVETFQNIVNIPVQECWISKVDPFTSVPFHIDEYDGENTWVNKQNKKLVRYIAFIDKPISNQIFIVGDVYYENIDQHTIVKWKSTRETHALINCSDKPNFLFHFLGFEHD
jgi:hypothetical protein